MSAPEHAGSVQQPSRARVVVIGGGIIGTSVAYHLAHAGCTGVEMMAVSGHSSLDQLQEYLEEVEQERAADAAMSKLANSAGTVE